MKSSQDDLPGTADTRCACGALLARRVAGGIELKCRRCRRRLLLRLGADGSISIEPPPRPSGGAS